ncbi:uncharacterized protein LOC115964526 [Quercus lobata]|uniref:uncharacterized protein LOC115964526 n=1 Tax=Quercus lobata TaxID=97700 RepID=UPI00124784A1|nr:uncharacterized protein LOC115964526 [Quercus lobata]
MGNSMFSFMDGYSGYNQIRMAAKDAKKTAFRTSIGNFYYTMMPFGLKNVMATYQQTMTTIFHDMMHKEMENYVDDIVVKSKTRAGNFQAIPLKNATRAAVANFIREHISTRFGIPKRLISNNGTLFINKDMKNLTEAYHIKHVRSTPYYPQGNGQVEATYRGILKILKEMKHEYREKWSAHLTDVLWACRSSLKTAIGFSPFFLVYGTVFPNLWDRSYQPRGASHPYTKSSTRRNQRRHKWHK